MKFIGRKEEQNAINYLLNKEGFQACVIYGRRRLGKTELVKHCLSDKETTCIYYQCNMESEDSNIKDLTNVLRELLDISNLYFENFVDIIEYIFKISVNKEFYFIIDEFPYIRKLIPGLDSKLQRVIDKYVNLSKMKFFLLGSSISTMEDIQSEKNPLYRRFNLSILLKEMDYYDSSKFYPTFSNEDKVKLYSAFGGVPFYNKQIDSNLSVEENIIKLISGKYSHINDEVTLNLKEELNKINNAYAVFSTIALGAFHYSDILSKSHVSTSSSLFDILDILLKMDLIEYISPINDKTNKKKSGYVITDSALNFYYKYVYHNLSAKTMLSEKRFYNRYIKHDFETNFVPKAFEKIAKQYLTLLNREGQLEPVLIDIGTYWYDNPIEKRNGQFDVVGKSDDGYVFFEVKFIDSLVDDTIIKEEISQVAKTNLKPIQFGFISKNGFSLKNKYPYIFIKLDDLYNL
mgnify:CR=1 FL=1